jgi:DNA adenine methylase
MKTPISYYSGKQNMVKDIISLIPNHVCYVEPFIGGGALFFAKESSKVEVINDIDGYLINFYKVLKTKYNELKKMLDVTLHSKQQYLEARNIYKNKDKFSDVENAWAFWVLTQEAYGNKFDYGWGFAKKYNTITTKIKNKIDNFTEAYCKKLRMTQIECDDALRIIPKYDTENTFFYCDPPYFNSDCGKYKGYSDNDFESLLKVLSGIKGKFLLSSYPSDMLDWYKTHNNWDQISFEKFISMSSNLSETKYKTEVLTYNYGIGF